MVLGVFVYGTMLRGGDRQKSHFSQEEAESERQPASVPVIDASSISKKDIKNQVVTIDLDCLKRGSLPSIDSSARQVRVRGRLCDQGLGSKLVSSTIMNRSNGYTASSFHLKGRRFTSDYISLAPGTNQILLSFEGENQKSFLAELKIKKE